MAADVVLVDLDGTIWDSHPWYASIAARGDARARRRHALDLRAGHAAATLLKGAGVTPASFARTAATGPQAELFDDVTATLDELAERGTQVGAVTNLPAWIAGPMLDSLGIGLEVLVTFGSARRRKPHPDPLLLALDELGAAPHGGWYVGDSEGDARAAQAAGLSFAWASWGYGDRPPRGTDVVLDAFGEVLDL